MSEKVNLEKVEKNEGMNRTISFHRKIMRCVMHNSYLYITPYTQPEFMQNILLNYLAEGLCIEDAIKRMKKEGFPMSEIVSEFRSFLVKRNLVRYMTEAVGRR
ncbi:MAG: hypothetical protein GY765_29720 [bacterium]|nr:hypothetical protein [bacterium]